MDQPIGLVKVLCDECYTLIGAFNMYEMEMKIPPCPKCIRNEHEKLKIMYQPLIKRLKHPRIGCAAVITTLDEDCILLGIRNKDPNRGKWIFPGGGIHFLESMYSAVEREILEETNFCVKIDKTIGIYEIITPPDEHRLIIYWWAHYISGDLIPSSDLEDAKFFSRKEIRVLVNDNLSTSLTAKVLYDIGWI